MPLFFAQLMTIFRFIGMVLEDIFKLGVDADAGTEFCKWVQAHSSPWFLATCAAAIAYRNHPFSLYQQSKSSTSKFKFRQASSCYKRVLEAAKLVLC